MWLFFKNENALTFLFFKVMCSEFQNFFVSSWNVDFRGLLCSGEPWGWYSITIYNENFRKCVNSLYTLYNKELKFSLYTVIEYHPQGRPEHKRHRKSTFQLETKMFWNSEHISLKNKKHAFLKNVESPPCFSLFGEAAKKS